MWNGRASWVVVILLAVSGCSESKGSGQPLNSPDAAAGDGGTLDPHTQVALEEGRRTFRFDTFGDEAFWGDRLKLHQAIEGQASPTQRRTTWWSTSRACSASGLSGGGRPR